MQRRAFLLGAAALAWEAAPAEAAALTLAKNGRTEYPIVLAPDATAPERYAAEELARWLKEATGATFPITTTTTPPRRAIVLQADPKLADEETHRLTKGSQLLLRGGRPRGVLYAVYRFLQDQVGIRWWTPWATDIPKRPTLALEPLDLRARPAFETRDPYWYPAFDADWAARNFSNSASAHLDERHGGAVRYKGFVHTFYPLVPPEQYFATHPEWYSLLNGKRTADRAQLCTTNPELREFLVAQVRQWLKESPEARIVSISQNDWYNACQCEACKAIDDAEGTYAGTMLTLVNFIAARLGKEFPQVAFDTLAYQYTRKAPKTIKPLPNVIVRLCSIECNFRSPLADGKGKNNAAFVADIEAWSKLSQRLYIWDYTTNFGQYTLPHPNWFTLGPNVRFFHQHGVRGLFEQGAYQSHGSEMSELRAWLLAQLLWNPYQDDRVLIDQFLAGYYGKASGRKIREYLDLMYAAAEPVNLTCFAIPLGPHLSYATLHKADQLWQGALALAESPEKRWRIEQAHNVLRYAVLIGWARLRRESQGFAGAWPWGESQAALAQQWLKVATSTDGAPTGWKPMSQINEGGLTPQAFAARYSDTSRPDNTPLPPQLAGVDPAAAVTLQENFARLANAGEWAEVKPDPLASNGKAVRMPGTHHEWAFQLPLESVPERLQQGKWQVYALIRVEPSAQTQPAALAFTAGIYDTAAAESKAEVRVTAREAQAGYGCYLLGTVATSGEQYVWIAPAVEAKVTAIWVDRLVFVRA